MGWWPDRAMRLWKEWDEQYTDKLLPWLLYRTGDLIMRDEMTQFMEQSMENWDVIGHEYEILTPEDIRHRWSVIHTPEIGAEIYDPSGGMVRARRTIESVAQVFLQEGGQIRIARAGMGDEEGRTLSNIHLENGGRLEAGLFVIAVGPWFAKFLPEFMGRWYSAGGVGHVYYFATPPGLKSCRYPDLPSYNVPGMTVWPALP